MAKELEKKLNTLRVDIENLRNELHLTIDKCQGSLNNTNTCDISERLDELVAEYLRLKEKLNCAYEVDYYVKLKPNPSK